LLRFSPVDLGIGRRIDHDIGPIFGKHR
jgi:hypothetical protein